jgi:hypothetical protein
MLVIGSNTKKTKLKLLKKLIGCATSLLIDLTPTKLIFKRKKSFFSKRKR